MKELSKTRIDKWLWAVRIFKTRTLAKTVIDAGKVKLGEEKMKASQLVSVGDIIKVKVNYYFKTLKVLKVIEKRVGAPLAAECYEDLTPEGEKPEMMKSAFFMPTAFRERGTGRPTKKERRDIDRFTEGDDVE
jgi:ribosome-associated heat shock protein Hsp15